MDIIIAFKRKFLESNGWVIYQTLREVQVYTIAIALYMSVTKALDQK